MTRLFPLAFLLLAGCTAGPNVGGGCTDWLGTKNLVTVAFQCRPDQRLVEYQFKVACFCERGNDGGAP